MSRVRAFPSLLLLMLVACEQPKRPTPQPPMVTLGATQQRDVVDHKVFVGRTDAFERVEIRARVEGFLKSVDFEPSQFVKAGQLLFTIEPDSFALAVAHAKAALDRSQAEFDRAQADLERVEIAVKTNAVSKQEVSLRKADRDKAKAQVESAEAALADAKLKLGYTKVTSPIAGRVSRNLRDVGNLVGSGEKTLLTTVMRLDPIYVYFDISEDFIVQYLKEKGISRDMEEVKKRKDLPVAVALTGETGFPHAGYIDYVDNTADPETGTIAVRGVLDNAKGTLYPGLFARIQVPGATIKNAVLAKETAIGTDLAGKYLLTVGDKNIVERKYVELGPLQDGWRVVTGIGAGEDYIVEGVIRARPGLPVRTQRESESGGAKAPAKDPK